MKSRRGEKKKKKNPPSRAQLFFFLKRKSLESARFASRRPAPQPRAPPLSARDLGSVTSLIPPSSGFLLLCCCFSSGRKAGSTFSFCKWEQEPVPSPAAVSILSRSFFKLLQGPRTTYSLRGVVRTQFPSANLAGRGDWKLGSLGRTKPSTLGFHVCWGGFFFFLFSWRECRGGGGRREGRG